MTMLYSCLCSLLQFCLTLLSEMIPAFAWKNSISEEEFRSEGCLSDAELPLRDGNMDKVIALVSLKGTLDWKFSVWSACIDKFSSTVSLLCSISFTCTSSNRRWLHQRTRSSLKLDSTARQVAGDWSPGEDSKGDIWSLCGDSSGSPLTNWVSLKGTFSSPPPSYPPGYGGGDSEGG